MKPSHTLFLLVLLLYACASGPTIDDAEEVLIDCDKQYEYVVEITSTGDFEHYDSAVTMFAEENEIFVNDTDTTVYLTQFPLYQNTENRFLVESSKKLFVRLILGESTSNESVDNAEIRIKIFQDDPLIHEDLFTIKQDDRREVIFIDIEPCD